MMRKVFFFSGFRHMNQALDICSRSGAWPGALQKVLVFCLFWRYVGVMGRELCSEVASNHH